jgi:hypothetical protein
VGLGPPWAGDVQENAVGTYLEDQKQLVELAVRQTEDHSDRNVKVPVLVRDMLQSHMDRWGKRRGWMTSVHAVPNLGRKDQGAGKPRCELMVDGLGMGLGLNSIDPAGRDAGKDADRDADKDADKEAREACEAAVGGVIGTRQSESLDEKKVER